MNHKPERSISTDRYRIKIFYNNNCDQIRNEQFYYCMEEMFSDLFPNIFNFKLDLSGIIIIHYYSDCPVITFYLTFDNGFIMYNEENYIKLSSISPQIAIFDTAYKKIIEKKSKEIVNRDLIVKCPMIKTNDKKNDNKRHDVFIEKGNNIAQTFIEQRKDFKKYFDEEFEAKKEKERNRKIEENRNNEKIKVFESDKKTYLQIKKDIDDGILKKENMNPYFVLKYQLFKLLESRGNINFASNANVKDEYELFMDLYNDCTEDEQENIKQDAKVFISPDKVYIPPNYNYMTNEKKEEYARKYKMTLKQFEEKYINNNTNNNMFNTPTNLVNNDKSSGEKNISDTSFESDTDSEPKIDQNFLSLINEYSKTTQ